MEDVDLFEINEAFASVTMAAMADNGLGHDRQGLDDELFEILEPAIDRLLPSGELGFPGGQRRLGVAALGPVGCGGGGEDAGEKDAVLATVDDAVITGSLSAAAATRLPKRPISSWEAIVKSTRTFFSAGAFATSAASSAQAKHPRPLSR